MSHEINTVLGLYNYWIVIFLMMTGFYVVIAKGNLVKKIIGLNLFQISVFLLYLSMGKINGGTTPIYPDKTFFADLQDQSSTMPVYSHPLPSVLILTAIVVGIATTALALALIVRIHEAYGTIEEDEILLQDQEA